MKTTGTLFLCATPIGNLEDITLRVLRTLQEVDLIAAEDTRNSIKLLNHFQIKTPMTSYHEYNKVDKAVYLVNKLREGLDIPEVSLVAILEADKEGFLRSRRSLVQTIGRAARNIEGRVILYGDIMTDSMKQAIDETNRRRKIQNEYNVFNNIDPKTIVKEISEDLINLDYGLDINETEGKDKKTFTSRKDIEKEIIKLQKQIAKLSKELDFENAIIKRDEMTKLKKLLLDF